MKIDELKANPAVFRRALLIDTDNGPRILSTKLESWQLDDFRAMDAAWRSVAGQDVDVDCRYFWRERPRGHSKTTDLAVMLTWVLWASPDRIFGITAAGDEDQARLLLDAMAKLVALNSKLLATLDVQKSLVRNRETGAECRFIASDAPSSYGITPDFLVVDEISHHGKRDLWDSLISSAAKRANCIVVVLTNAGWMGTWQWETRAAVMNSPAWHFSRLDGPRASWITPARLAEQQRLLPPTAFRRLWYNEWAAAGQGDALDAGDIAACVTLDGPTAEREQGWSYIIGADLGIKHDATAVVTIGVHVGHVETVTKKLNLPHSLRIIRQMDDPHFEDETTEYITHEGSYRLKLVDVWVRKPSPGVRVDLAEVEAAVTERCRRFDAVAVVDIWQAESLVQNLSKAGLPVEGAALSWSSLQAAATAVMDCFRDRTIDLFPCPVLEADLRSLQITESRLGFRLTAPRVSSGQGTRHADTASALQLAIWGARRYASRAATVPGELLVWPPG